MDLEIAFEPHVLPPPWELLGTYKLFALCPQGCFLIVNESQIMNLSCFIIFQQRTNSKVMHTFENKSHPHRVTADGCLNSLQFQHCEAHLQYGQAAVIQQTYMWMQKVNCAELGHSRTGLQSDCLNSRDASPSITMGMSFLSRV